VVVVVVVYDNPILKDSGVAGYLLTSFSDIPGTRKTLLGLDVLSSSGGQHLSVGH
jgi:hypothetical protein